MATKPVTFQGQFNFNANLYALEVKSRFIDQAHADGYYTDYGEEIAAKIIGGNKIQVGTGALVVQGRMFEITAAEIIQPQIFDGFKGYIVARIETFHPADEGNCTIIAKIQTSWEALDRELEQNDVYASTADNINTAYELPLFSFEISGTQIVNLVQLIKPVCDYATIKKIVDDALDKAKDAVAKAASAVSTANAANTKSDNAVSTANAANTKSDAAVKTANQAAADAATALSVANALDGKITDAVETARGAVEIAEAAAEVAGAATERVNDLEKQIAEGQGTEITKDGQSLAKLAVNETPTAGAAALYDQNGNLKSSAPLADSDCIRVADIVAIFRGDGICPIITTDSGDNLEDMGGNALQYILKI